MLADDHAIVTALHNFALGEGAVLQLGSHLENAAINRLFSVDHFPDVVFLTAASVQNFQQRQRQLSPS